LVARGELETREEYRLKQYALLPINRVPDSFQPMMRRYAEWLRTQKLTFETIRDHMEALAAFINWCGDFKINVPEGVSPSDFNNYLAGLYKQWKCLACAGTINLSPNEPTLLALCPHCSSHNLCVEVGRYNHHTVRKECSKLKKFYTWAKLNRLTVINPVKRKIMPPQPGVRHYPPEIMRKLAATIIDTSTDPVEALSLYLIIFHALSIWELRHAELPTIFRIKQDHSNSLAEAYYLTIPERTPSRGKRSSGRQGTKLCFPAEAVQWLKPLLERYDKQRMGKTQNANNRYLLVAKSSTVRNEPVCAGFIKSLLKRASSRILNAAISPGLLRQTSAVLFVEYGDGSVLSKMGWSPQHGWKYTWMPRQVINPQQIL
jgi:site-specific recombinase XerD